MAGTILTIIYAVLVIGLAAIFLTLEIASRKARVYAAPSTPWMRRVVIRRLKEIVAETGRNAPVIYELGAGWGTLALAAARACPNGRVIGYDLARVPLMIARLRAKLRGIKNVEFIEGDFFKVDLSEGDILLTYLTENLLEELGHKLQRELQSGAHVICNTFGIKGWTPVRVDPGQRFILNLDVYTYIKR